MVKEKSNFIMILIFIYFVPFLIIILGCPDEVPSAKPKPVLVFSEYEKSDLTKDIIGSTHTDGKYYFSATDDFLNEGADRILSWGSRVIKVWFDNVESKYTFNSSWPSMYTMVDIAKSPYMQELFAKDFMTFIILCHARPDISFTDGMTSSERSSLESQMYDLAKYFLTTYSGTNKTFIFQNWEGDWLARGHFNAGVDPTTTALNGMIAWLNARQAGVNRAIADYGNDHVWVFHAVEINLVKIYMDNPSRDGVVNKVLPYTNCDLVSYSSYDTSLNYADNTTDPDFVAALNFIDLNAPSSKYFGEKNIYIGEYGCAKQYYNQTQIENVISTTTMNALNWGCPFVLYWQVYCNEFSGGDVSPDLVTNDDVRGFWLIKPDGTQAWAYTYLQGLF